MKTYTYRCTNTNCLHIARTDYPVRRVVNKQPNRLYPGLHRRHKQPTCKECHHPVELLHQEEKPTKNR